MMRDHHIDIELIELRSDWGGSHAAMVHFMCGRLGSPDIVTGNRRFRSCLGQGKGLPCRGECREYARAEERGNEEKFPSMLHGD